MRPTSQHTIILPYFCDQEVTRYLQIAEKLKSFPRPTDGYRFLLASSPRTQTNQHLVNAYSQLGETIAFSCPTQIFGYPEGPTAMFWDCMDFLAEHFSDKSGFGLWLESDMAPVQPDWLDRLSAEWYESEQTPIMMGCYVPEVYRPRLFRKSKLILDPHINGGACYAMDFARQMPAAAREGVFDVVVYEHAQRLGRAKPTRQIAFSTRARVRRDLLDSQKVLLHGYMQEKDGFIGQCLRPLTEREKSAAAWNFWQDQIEDYQRQLRVNFIRKGPKALLDHMLLAKKKFEAAENQEMAEPQIVHRAA